MVNEQLNASDYLIGSGQRSHSTSPLILSQKEMIFDEMIKAAYEFKTEVELRFDRNVTHILYYILFKIPNDDSFYLCFIFDNKIVWFFSSRTREKGYEQLTQMESTIWLNFIVSEMKKLMYYWRKYCATLMNP